MKTPNKLTILFEPIDPNVQLPPNSDQFYMVHFNHSAHRFKQEYIDLIKGKYVANFLNIITCWYKPILVDTEQYNKIDGAKYELPFEINIDEKS